MASEAAAHKQQASAATCCCCCYCCLDAAQMSHLLCLVESLTRLTYTRLAVVVVKSRKFALRDERTGKAGKAREEREALRWRRRKNSGAAFNDGQSTHLAAASRIRAQSTQCSRRGEWCRCDGHVKECLLGAGTGGRQSSGALLDTCRCCGQQVTFAADKHIRFPPL